MTYFKRSIRIYDRQHSDVGEDHIAVEEPLQIMLRKSKTPFREALPFAITMRTPGRDNDLVVGQLYNEGVISKKEDIHKLDLRGPMSGIMDVTVEDWVDLKPFESNRTIVNHSGCGVCGKTSLEFMEREGAYFHRPGLPLVPSTIFEKMLRVLDTQQSTFQKTGGVHAAAIFTKNGTLLQLCEDVGRHNAMDKLTGWGLNAGRIPFRDNIVLYSGRTSFELIQKAHEAGLAVVASIGAPSSLAIELAEQHGMTLIGFLKTDRFNVYNDHNRIEYVEENVG